MFFIVFGIRTHTTLLASWSDGSAHFPPLLHDRSCDNSKLNMFPFLNHWALAHVNLTHLARFRELIETILILGVIPTAFACTMPAPRPHTHNRTRIHTHSKMLIRETRGGGNGDGSGTHRCMNQMLPAPASRKNLGRALESCAKSCAELAAWIQNFSNVLANLYFFWTSYFFNPGGRLFFLNNFNELKNF